ncbi:hypothetical protein Cni_G14003 [Canna indica]|uniref:Uncharacterized protein n=1 Tax=Canna indica TaxID=4628 RepID=A0AAQ3KGX4_9LILI|nr:hypothetical protein Cni_G14003 [Canna indica]
MKHDGKNEDRNRREQSYNLMPRSSPHWSTQFERYTPLTTSRELILQEVHYLQLLRPPGCPESSKYSYKGDKSKRKVLVDQDSSADVLFYPTLERMGINESSLCLYHGELVSYSGDHCASPFGFLNNLDAVVSTPYLAVKFPISKTEVEVIHADQREARACYNEFLKLKPAKPQPRISGLYPIGDIQERPQPADNLDPVQIEISPEQVTYIRAHLPNDLKARLSTLLKSNADLFTWTLVYKPGIDPQVICHRLAIDPRVKPIA